MICEHLFLIHFIHTLLLCFRHSGDHYDNCSRVWCTYISHRSHLLQKVRKLRMLPPGESRWVYRRDRQANGQTDERQTVTLRFPIDAANLGGISGGRRGPDPHFLEWDGPPLYTYISSLLPHFSDQSYTTTASVIINILTLRQMWCHRNSNFMFEMS